MPYLLKSLPLSLYLLFSQNKISTIDNHRYNDYLIVMAGRLRKEIKQAKPFTSLEEEVFLNLIRTADALMRRFSEVLRPVELTPTQYNVLRILRGAEPDGLSCREIGDRMVTHDPDITRMLDRLEKRGLVVRRRDLQDRRVINTRITPEGLRLIAGIDQKVADFHRSELKHINASNLNRLNSLLEETRSCQK